MSPEDEFSFSIAPTVFGPFKIGTHLFVLKEATEAAHIDYRDTMMRSMRASESKTGEKIATVTGGSDAESVLIMRCLFRRTENTNGGTTDAQVPLDFVRALPRRITSKLYAKVREISGMDEEQETEEFLTKRIESDRAKLETLSKKGAPSPDGPSSTSGISVTPGPSDVPSGTSTSLGMVP
jgi:hypothetical protein